MRLRDALVFSTIVACATQLTQASEGSAKTERQSARTGMSERGSQSSKVSEVRLSKLMDASVKSNTGENLGQLEDLAINPQTGEIQFAILGRGGFLGIGEKYVPVPWKAINLQSEKEFTLNVDKEKLKTAPTTDKEFSNLQDPGYTVTIYRFFAVPEVGASGSPGGVQTGSGSSSQSATNSSSRPGELEK